jgi:THO complex subunit 4
VELSYGPGGVSRGIATIFFTRPDSAVKAVESQNGVMVDNRSMKVCLLFNSSLVCTNVSKIDVILDARRAAALPPPKGLSDRIT